MTDDISPILTRWPFDEDAGLQVRRIEGADGSLKLQIRIDLGLMQLEAEDRPDGQRPFGYPSLLDYYRALADRHRREHGWYEGFELDSQACAALRRESLQYYHRRIAWMALQEYSRAIADADHNLQILDLLKAFARDREDWLASEQYRAFITCHRVQCLAMLHLQHEDVRTAMMEVARGLRQIREIYAEQGSADDFETSTEREMLEEFQRKLEARYQVSHRQHLQILLDDALRREDPDMAAEIRARLRELETDR